ncbi:acid-sensing ion channel 1-like isoform X2 [Ptychodera flava]|uniref:acid-sensing ion channel 1-like isoform X2 n=1 Tax=Ptychodera flava TaxID=63121 RepID=UPI00396A6115
MKYVDELTFPAVAICNFNLHRPTWQGNFLSKDDFTPILTDFGVCYTFNAGDGNDTHKVKNTGRSFGFSVYLNAVEFDYNIGPRQGLGFQVMLYQQGDIPLVADLGFAVSVGEEVLVGVDVTSIQNLPPPHGSCGKKHLKYYDEYSRNACRMECKTDYMVDYCGCRMFYMPGNATVCDFRVMYVCGQVALAELMNEESRCECPLPCTQVIYKPNLSHAKYTYQAFANFQAEYFGVPPEYFESNLVKLHIFFQELAIHEVQEEVAYNIFGLLCDIGGSLGLWLGGSILTVIEILDICFKGCCGSAWH